MKNYYDIAIIGGGIGGLMTAWRLTERDPALSVCIIEKGHSIEKRTCPIVAKKVDKCIKCPSCAIMEGLAGAGAFSDGKYVISTEYGGWLTDFLKPETVIDYIEQADQILVSFGATTERFLPSNELKRPCLQHGLFGPGAKRRQRKPAAAGGPAHGVPHRQPEGPHHDGPCGPDGQRRQGRGAPRL